ncbi:metallophosphoesterase family protein [Lacrimispora celerecrescens]|uniref:Putative phosphodiesterase n=1 Tax=[Clostridium] celerecrescens 18A TaxID=1286362 RepID=A0A2M8Z1H0_9FIRM|nr:metallophosphoesterase family protein [Lacrimispora celerecrescens]PJJ27297.1 putative phosphodiesterase [[Clostridium] celerecrescens 18A]
MDFAVLSDIHGNYIALEKCVEYALSRGVKAFAFLGDYVGELAYPEKTMKMIFEMAEKYNCYFIRGNKEDYWIDYYNNGELGWKDKDSTTGSLLYSMIVCGHTHIQTKFEINGKTVLNAGSVGVPLFSNRKSQFLILHQTGKQWKEEFISIEYDVEKVIEELHTSGLNKYAPYWCIVTENLLRNGNISPGTVLKRAMALCKAETGTCIWPDIPEQYWRQAVEEILVNKQIKV